MTVPANMENNKFIRGKLNEMLYLNVEKKALLLGYKNNVEKKRSLSYKEKQELQSLEGILDKLEKRKNEITTLLSTTTHAEELVKLSEEFSQVEEDLDEKTMRWLELEEIKAEG